MIITESIIGVGAKKDRLLIVKSTTWSLAAALKGGETAQPFAKVRELQAVSSSGLLALRCWFFW